MSAARISRKAAAFVDGHGGSSVLDVLSLNAVKQHRPLPKPLPTVERRVVNTVNSDCVAYTFAEFEAFFGNAAQRHWDAGLRLRPSTVAQFLAVDESDQEEQPPFCGLAAEYNPGQFFRVREVRLLREGGLVPVTKKSLRTRRPSPRAQLRFEFEEKLVMLIRGGLPREFAVEALRL